MSEEGTYCFFLPPGTFKTENIQSIIFTQKDGAKVSCQFSVDGKAVTLSDPNMVNGMPSWDMTEYHTVLKSNASSFQLQVKGFPLVDFNLDSILPICQVSSRLDKNILPDNIFIVKLRAGYFAREVDYKGGQIFLDKPVYLSSAKRSAYENACKQNLQMQQSFEETSSQSFQSIYKQFLQYNRAKHQEHIKVHKELSDKCKDYPVSSTIGQTIDFSDHPKISRKIKIKPPESENPVLPIADFPITPSTAVPPKEDIKSFLSDLNSLFPVNPEKRILCDISEDNTNPEAHKMFLFNVLHFCSLFATFTGVVFDYRLSIKDGWWNLEDRATGIDVKRDLGKGSFKDSAYHCAVAGCLRKLSEDLRVCRANDDKMCETIAALQKYYISM